MAFNVEEIFFYSSNIWIKGPVSFGSEIKIARDDQLIEGNHITQCTTKYKYAIAKKNKPQVRTTSRRLMNNLKNVTSDGRT